MTESQEAEREGNEMTREEALIKVKGYLTNIIPEEDYSEVEVIIKALEQDNHMDFCPHCGAKIVDPQESEAEK